MKAFFVERYTKINITIFSFFNDTIDIQRFNLGSMYLEQHFFVFKQESFYKSAVVFVNITNIVRIK